FSRQDRAGFFASLRMTIFNFEFSTFNLNFLLLLVALSVLSACRLDMHTQPKYKPLEQSTFFDDGRSERPVVPGTVPRGHLRIDEHLYTGRINGALADTFPFPDTRQDLDRVRESNNI